MHVIEAYRAQLDLARIGYYWYKIEFKLSSPTGKKRMLDYFAHHPNVVYSYETTGEADLEVEVEVESYEEFRRVLGQMRAEFKGFIESYTHLLWFKEHKLRFFSAVSA